MRRSWRIASATLLLACNEPSCPVPANTTRLEISVEGAAAACASTHVEGASLLGADPDAASGGVRIHLDFCPTAGGCACDVVVSEIGTDIAADLAPETNLTVDLQTVPPMFEIGQYVSITRAPSCACATCGCAEPVVVYAARAALGQPARSGVAVAEGTQICAAVPCDYGGLSRLAIALHGTHIELRAGETEMLGLGHARAISDASNGAVCSGGPGNAETASYVVWTSR